MQMRRGDVSENDMNFNLKASSLTSMNRGNLTARTIGTANSQRGIFNAATSLPHYNRATLATRQNLQNEDSSRKMITTQSLDSQRILP